MLVPALTWTTATIRGYRFLPRPSDCFEATFEKTLALYPKNGLEMGINCISAVACGYHGTCSGACRLRVRETQARPGVETKQLPNSMTSLYGLIHQQKRSHENRQTDSSPPSSDITLTATLPSAVDLQHALPVGNKKPRFRGPPRTKQRQNTHTRTATQPHTYGPARSQPD